MNAVIIRVLILGSVLSAGLLGLGNGTKVNNCLDKRPQRMFNVELTGCEDAPCILKKNTTLNIRIEFKPDNDVARLKNVVNARLGGLPMPFIGMDGTSACDNIYQEKGSIKTGCPLRAGTDYVYKNSIPILPMYPTVNALVHWALWDTAKKENVACFEIKSKIVSQ